MANATVTRVYNYTPIYLWGIPPQLAENEVGIEIEVEGTNLPREMLSWWAVTEDGSLRGEESAEYVLRRPITRDEVPKAMSYLAKHFAKAGSKPNVESNRTSVHIHLNMQNNTIKQAFNLFTLHSIIEDALFEFCGRDRKGNLFCLRASDAEYLIHYFSEQLRKNIFQPRADSIRYSACNLASLSKFGSIEFRGMGGCVDADRIQTWIKILLALKDAALEYDNPTEIIRAFSILGPRRIMSDIFSGKIPTSAYNILMGTPELDRRLFDGMRVVQDLAYAIPTWEPSTEVKKPTVKKKEELRAPPPPPLDWSQSIHYRGIEAELDRVTVHRAMQDAIDRQVRAQRRVRD